MDQWRIEWQPKGKGKNKGKSKWKCKNKGKEKEQEKAKIKVRVINHREKAQVITEVTPKVQEKESPNKLRTKARVRRKESGIRVGATLHNSQQFALL